MLPASQRRPFHPDSRWPEPPLSETIGDGADLARRVQAVFQSPDYEPPMLPRVAVEVLALTRTLDADVLRIVDLLESDPILAGRLLQLANSAVYRGSGRTRTLREAVVRLGLSTLRELLWQVAIGMRVFQGRGGYTMVMEALRRHATATAQLARHIAGYTHVDVEKAFLCGLLHEIGIAAILLALGDVKRGDTPPSLAQVWPLAEKMHGHVGAFVARLWGLSPEVAYVIERHGRVPAHEAAHPLVAVLLIAEDLACIGGHGVSFELPGGVVVHAVNDVDPLELLAARTALNLAEPEMKRVRREAADLLAGLG